MSITNVGVVTALTHNNGDAMILIFGAAIVLIVFFIIDIISLILGKKQKGYLLPGYVGVSIGVKCIAILFLVLAYIKSKYPPPVASFKHIALQRTSRWYLLLYTLICQKYGRQYILTHNLRIYADRIFYLPNYL